MTFGVSLAQQFEQRLSVLANYFGGRWANSTVADGSVLELVSSAEPLNDVGMHEDETETCRVSVVAKWNCICAIR